VIVEVKVRFSALLPLFTVDANGLISTVARYSLATGRRCQGWLVVVYASGTPGDLTEAAHRLSAVLEPFGTASIVQREEIPELALPLVACQSLCLLGGDSLIRIARPLRIFSVGAGRTLRWV
jgi:hypothetical protein